MCRSAGMQGKQIMEKIKTNAQLIFSFSIICLAMAISYFAYEVDQFLENFPGILVQMEKTSVEISPVIENIAETTRNIVPISEKLERVAEITPSILEEVKSTREALPDILQQTSDVMEQINTTGRLMPEVIEEIRQTRELIPDILEEIRKSREVIADATEKLHQAEEQVPLILAESENIRKDLPAVIQTMDRASESVRLFSEELGKLRPLIPDILAEVRKTRTEIPEMLDQAERITLQGQKFGSDAGKGVVTGLISLLNPITLTKQLKDLVLPGKDIRGLTAEDIELIRETTAKIVETGNTGSVLKWENEKSGNRGRFSVVREFSEDDISCKEIRTEIWINDEQSHDFNLIFCLQTDGTWVRKGKPAAGG